MRSASRQLAGGPGCVLIGLKTAMRRVSWASWLVSASAALALGLVAPPLAGAQALVPGGSEFQVNSYTTNNQRNPSVAVNADGDFVVVWGSSGSSVTDPSSESIQGQRYASNRSTLGTEFQVSTDTTNAKRYPSVAADADGDFVVVRWSGGSYGTDTSGSSIQGQRYSVAAALPSMSPATRSALGAALLLLGASYALRRRW